MSPVDWGDVPTWMGAVFAAGAAAATVWTLASQRTQIKEQREFIAIQAANLALERAELEASLAERKSEQARYARFRIASVRYLSDEEMEWIVAFENGSREPIRAVTVHCAGAAPVTASLFEEEPEDWNYLPNFGGPIEMPIDVVGPGRKYAFLIRGSVGMRPIAAFTDNNGVRWRLDEHSDLREAEAG